MKKFILPFLLLLLCLLPVTAFAASVPEILLEPQNLIWPVNSVAGYSVEAYGENLNYKWYIVYDGKTYDTTRFEEGLPWVGFGMSGCGASEGGKTFYINGIVEEANGARIYCEVTSEAGRIRSREAVISVGGSALPPDIRVVSNIVVAPNQPASIQCTATDPKGGSVAYTWLETGTGELWNAVAINRGAETDQTLNCDTGTPGTRYYVCMVTTSSGGMGYSSVVPVTVKEPDTETTHHHEFGDWMVTTEPTCTESGIKARECDCGHTERAEIPPTGHHWDEGKIAVLPTADTDGEMLYSCAVCGQMRPETIKTGPTGETSAQKPAEAPASVNGTAGADTPQSAFPWWAVLIAGLLLGAAAGVLLSRAKRR